MTVPGSKVVAGKTVPGTITVDVIADKPGTSYNIPAGNFVIMAFVEKGDTEKSKQFYGVSDQPMSGGASGPSTVVTQANYDQALAAATDDVKNQIKTALEAQGPSLMVIDGDKPVMKDPQSTARADDAASAVTVTRPPAARRGSRQWSSTSPSTSSCRWARSPAAPYASD